MIELKNRAEGKQAYTEFRLSSEELSDMLLSLVESDYPELMPEQVMVWHTHPGGLVGPSDGDMQLKQRLKNSGLVFRWCVVSLGDESNTEAIATEY